MGFKFDAADLKAIVRSLAKSNVKILKLDLNDEGSIGGGEANLLSKGKYHPLFELLSNRKLQQLTLSGMSYFAARTSDLPKNQKQSTLRSLQFILEDVRDIPRCLSILSFCANLVDLRLVANNEGLLPGLGSAIRSMKRLEVLHLTGMRLFDEKSQESPLSAIAAADIKLRELMVKDAGLRQDGPMDEVVHACESMLEVLIVNWKVSLQSPQFKYEYGFPKLTRLETYLVTTESTLQLFDSTLKHRLSHLGTIVDRRILLKIADFTALRSLAIGYVEACDLLPLWKSFPENGGSSQIESLSLESIRNYDEHHPHLMAISLRKLLVFSKLEALAVPKSIYQSKSDDEDLISARQDEFSTQLTIHILSSDYSEGSGLREEDIKKLDPQHVKTCESTDFKTRHDLM
ncbi:hypothetical protein BGX26_007406, partial [Mortierella sp. AD094]